MRSAASGQSHRKNPRSASVASLVPSLPGCSRQAAGTVPACLRARTSRRSGHPCQRRLLLSSPARAGGGFLRSETAPARAGAILIHLAEASRRPLPTELLARSEVLQWPCFQIERDRHPNRASRKQDGKTTSLAAECSLSGSEKHCGDLLLGTKSWPRGSVSPYLTE